MLILPRRFSLWLDRRNLYALWIIPPESAFRKWCKMVSSSWYFDLFMMVMLVLDCICLGFADPFCSNSHKNQILDSIDVLPTVMFLVEMVLKICCYGFFVGKSTYLRYDGWNVLDFFVVISSSISLFASISGESSPMHRSVKTLRVIRVLRPLRTIARVPSLQRTLASLMASLPHLRDSSIVLASVILFLALIEFSDFRGLFTNHCISADGSVLNDNRLCGGTLQCPWNTRCAAQRLMTSDGDGTLSLCWDGNSTVAVGLNSSTCSWVKNEPVDHTINTTPLHAVLNVLTVVTSEGWSNIMYLSFDSGSLAGSLIYYIVAVFLATFTLNSLVIAVVTDNFMEVEKEARNVAVRARRASHRSVGIRASTLPEKTHSFFHISRLAIWNAVKRPFRAVPGEPPSFVHWYMRATVWVACCMSTSSGFEGKHFRRQDNDEICAPDEAISLGSESFPYRSTAARIFHRVFDVVVFSFISINVIALCITFPGQPHFVTTLRVILIDLCSLVFLIEFSIKVVSLGFIRYFSNLWDLFDFCVVVLSIVEIYVEHPALIATRVLRILKVLRRIPALRLILGILYRSRRQSLLIFTLLMLILFVYALLGMSLFGGLWVHGADDGIRASFNDMGDSFVSVFIIVTGEFWNSLLSLSIDKLQNGLTETHNYCGQIACFERSLVPQLSLAITYTYYISLVLIGNFLFVNLFVSVMLDSFDELAESTLGGGRVCHRLNDFTSKIDSIIDDLTTSEDSANDIAIVFGDWRASRHDSSSKKLIRSKIDKSLGRLRSMFNFPTTGLPNNVITKIRIRLRALFDHAAMEFLILSAIVLSTIFLALEDRYSPPDSAYSRLTSAANDSFTYLFVSECIIKLFAFGIFRDPNRASWKIQLNALRHAYTKFASLSPECSARIHEHYIVKSDTSQEFSDPFEVVIPEKIPTRDKIIGDSLWKYLRKTSLFKAIFPGEVQAEDEPHISCNLPDILGIETDKCRPFSPYWKDAYNVMDFFIASVSFVALMANESDNVGFKSIAKQLRFVIVFRSLRPIRFISRLPKMRLLMKALKKCLRPLALIIVFSLAFFLFYAIIGMEMFQSSFHYCGLVNTDTWRSSVCHDDACQEGDLFVTSVLVYTGNITAYDHNMEAFLSDFNVDPSIPVQSIGNSSEDLMHYGMEMVPVTQELCLRGSFVAVKLDHLAGAPFTQDILITSPCDGRLWPTSWIERADNFDHLGRALLTIFTISCLEGWHQTMYYGQAASKANGIRTFCGHDPTVWGMRTFFFVSVVVIGNFILLNLFGTIVIGMSRGQRHKLFEYYGQRDWVILSQRIKRATVGWKPQELKSAFSVMSSRILAFEATLSKEQSTNLKRSIGRLKHLCRQIIEFKVPIGNFRFGFRIVVLLFLITNITALLFDGAHISDRQRYNIFLIDAVCVSFYIFEMIVKCIGYGFLKFFHSGWHCFEFFLVLTGSIAVVLGIINRDITSTELKPVCLCPGNIFCNCDSPSGAVIRTLVTLSLSFRLLGFIRSVRTLRVVSCFTGAKRLVTTLYLSLPAIANTFFLLILVIFIYAVLGMSLFGGLPRTSSWYFSYGGAPGSRYTGLESYYNSNDLARMGALVFPLEKDLAGNASFCSPETVFRSSSLIVTDIGFTPTVVMAAERLPLPRLKAPQSNLVGLSDYANFDSFGSSLMLLFRILTGEDWPHMMWDVSTVGVAISAYPVPPGYCSTTRGECGIISSSYSYLLTLSSFIYFVSFVLFGQYVVLNLFTAAIVEQFSDDAKSLVYFKASNISNFFKMWTRFTLCCQPEVADIEKLSLKNLALPGLALRIPSTFILDFLEVLGPPLGLPSAHQREIDKAAALKKCRETVGVQSDAISVDLDKWIGWSPLLERVALAFKRDLPCCTLCISRVFALIARCILLSRPCGTNVVERFASTVHKGYRQFAPSGTLVMAAWQFQDLISQCKTQGTSVYTPMIIGPSSVGAIVDSPTMVLPAPRRSELSPQSLGGASQEILKQLEHDSTHTNVRVDDNTVVSSQTPTLDPSPARSHHWKSRLFDDFDVNLSSPVSNVLLPLPSPEAEIPRRQRYRVIPLPSPSPFFVSSDITSDEQDKHLPKNHRHPTPSPIGLSDAVLPYTTVDAAGRICALAPAEASSIAIDINVLRRPRYRVLPLATSPLPSRVSRVPSPSDRNPRNLDVFSPQASGGRHAPATHTNGSTPFFPTAAPDAASASDVTTGVRNGKTCTLTAVQAIPPADPQHNVPRRQRYRISSGIEPASSH